MTNRFEPAGESPCASDTNKRSDQRKRARNKRTVFRTTFPLGAVGPHRFSVAFALCMASYVVLVSSDKIVALLGAGPAVDLFLTGVFLALAFVAPLALGGVRAYRELVGTLRPFDILNVVFFVFLTYFLAGIGAMFVSQGTENPTTELLRSPQGIAFLVGLLVVQLFVEEILAIVPFLTVYHLVEQYSKNEWIALACALFVSILFACAAHLPTYGYNLMQVIFIVGGARLGLALCYLKTKSLLVCYLTHLAYDAMLFALIYVAMQRGLM